MAKWLVYWDLNFEVEADTQDEAIDFVAERMKTEDLKVTYSEATVERIDP